MPASQVTATTTEIFDPWLSYAHWSGDTLTYSFPTSGQYYDYQSTSDVTQLNAAQQDAVRQVLDDISSFTLLNFVEVTETSSTEGTLRFATEVGLGGGYAYGPGDTGFAGDSFYGSKTTAPELGNEAYLYFTHEIGHNFGLRHGHEFEEFVETGFDSQEYTVVTYTDYVGDSAVDSYDSGPVDWAQSYMQLDIAALQYLYGANYASSGETWSGNTVYTFDPDTGEMFINGDGVGTPAGNRIFRTIWDGNGEDTYDLSNYTTDLQIDLSPGKWSTFATDQLADLNKKSTDSAFDAEGNVANARLVDDDTRSLIENAVGGSGKDTIRGNQTDNELSGNAGDDRLLGMAGEDKLSGDGGKDKIYGAGGNDRMYGGASADELNGGAGADKLYGESGDDLLSGGNGMDMLYGQNGDDTLMGGQGRDTLHGGAGVDVLYGGTERDIFTFTRASDSGPDGNSDKIKDFEVGLDDIDLSNLSTGTMTMSIGGSLRAGSPSAYTVEVSGSTFVYADVDGDRDVDFRLVVDGTIGLTVHDFVL